MLQIGDIGANKTAAVRWFLASSLQGTFSALNASFTSTNPLGDPSISALKTVDIHDLVHPVLLQPSPSPAAGGTPDTGAFGPDFLVDDIPDAAYTPDRVYSSSGGAVLPVAALERALVTPGVPTLAGSSATLTVNLNW